MGFGGQPVIKRRANPLPFFPNGQIIVCNGLSRIINRSTLCVSAAGRTWLPQSHEIATLSSFWVARPFSFITFESDSRLTSIELKTFSYSSLQSIVIHI
jgi:hypothetical protein